MPSAPAPMPMGPPPSGQRGAAMPTQLRRMRFLHAARATTAPGTGNRPPFLPPQIRGYARGGVAPDTRVNPNISAMRFPQPLTHYAGGGRVPDNIGMYSPVTVPYGAGTSLNYQPALSLPQPVGRYAQGGSVPYPGGIPSGGDSRVPPGILPPPTPGPGPIPLIQPPPAGRMPPGPPPPQYEPPGIGSRPMPGVSPRPDANMAPAFNDLISRLGFNPFNSNGPSFSTGTPIPPNQNMSTGSLFPRPPGPVTSSPPGTNPGGAPPINYRVGGRVSPVPPFMRLHGTGRDTVPAALTPGEVVLNKGQQAMVGHGRIARAIGNRTGMPAFSKFERGGEQGFNHMSSIQPTVPQWLNDAAQVATWQMNQNGIEPTPIPQNTGGIEWFGGDESTGGHPTVGAQYGGGYHYGSSPGYGLNSIGYGYFPGMGLPGSSQGPTLIPTYFDQQGYPYAVPVGGWPGGGDFGGGYGGGFGSTSAGVGGLSGFGGAFGLFGSGGGGVGNENRAQL